MPKTTPNRNDQLQLKACQIIVGSTFAMALAIKFWLMLNHFEHYDDVIPAYWTQLINQYDAAELASKASILNNITSLIEHQLILPIIKFVIIPIAIAKESTFAPLMFYFSQPFYITSDVQILNNFTTRIVPFLAAITPLIYSTLAYLRQQIPFEHFILLNSISFFPWITSIYGSQGHNAILGFTIPLLMLLKQYFAENRDTLENKLTILLLPFAILSHYLITLFIVPIYIEKLRKEYKKQWNKVLEFVAISSIPASFLLAFCYLIVVPRLSRNPGVHWNAGDSQQYLFQGTTPLDFFEFIIINFTDVWTGVAGVSTNPIIEYMRIFLITILIGLGIMSRQHRSIRFISAFVLLSTSLLIYNQILTFSPTRHLIFLLPVITILSVIGLSNIRARKMRTLFSWLIFSLSSAGFILSSPAEIDNRSSNLIIALDATAQADQFLWIDGTYPVMNARFENFELTYSAGERGAWFYYTGSKISTSKEEQNKCKVVACFGSPTCQSVEIMSNHAGRFLDTDYTSRYITSSQLISFGSFAGAGSNTVFIAKNKNCNLAN